MKIRDAVKRANIAVLTAVLSISSTAAILVPGIAHAAVNNCNWTGGGDGVNFSDATNWSSCGGVAPQTGDNLNFDNTSLGTLEILNNDINTLSVGSITYLGTNSIYDYGLAGNTMTVTNGINNVSTQGLFSIDGDLVISGAQTFNNTGFAVALFGSLSGSGHVTLTGGGAWQLDGDNSGFSGGFSSADGSIQADSATALGTGTTTITDGGELDLNFDTDTTFATPLSLGGNGISGSFSGSALYMNTLSFAGDGSTATLSGPIALTSDVLVGGFGNRILKVTGPLSAVP
jgi:hypothetical protein